MDQFKKTIDKYLKAMAEKDPVVAANLKKEGKSIEKCCDFIINEVKKSNRQGFADEEIYGLALHYYQEDNVEDAPHHNCKIVVNEEVKLSEEELAVAKAEAISEYKAKVIAEYKGSDKPKNKKKEQPKAVQPSLFGEEELEQTQPKDADGKPKPVQLSLFDF